MLLFFSKPTLSKTIWWCWSRNSVRVTFSIVICPRQIVLLLFPNCYKLILLRSSRVYEHIYTVKNMYNDFIILQEFFLRKKVRVYVVYVDISIIYKLQKCI